MHDPIRVLYVDDNPLDRTLVSDALAREHQGFTLTEANSRKQFEVELAALDVDIVLSDFDILGFEGLQVLDSVHTVNAGIPVIIVTGTGSEEIAVAAMRRGAAGYVIKSPQHIRQLPHTLRAILEKQDLEQRHRDAVEALRIAAKEWQTTFDAAGDVIWLLDDECRILRANATTRRHFHVDADDVVGKHCWEVVHGTSGPIRECPVLRMRETLRRETMELMTGGRTLQVTVDPVLDDDGTLQGIVHLVSDITERKRAEAERLQLERQVREAQKLESLGVLSAGVAHDFNNLLMVIMGNAEFLMDLPDSVPMHEGLSEIVEASETAADLCKQLVAYTGRGQRSIENISIQRLITDILGLLKSSVSKKIAVEVSVAHDLPCVCGDSTQLRQVIMNLVINAAEAIGDRNGVIAVSVDMVVDAPPASDTTHMEVTLPKGRYVRLRVSDTGDGMDEKTRKRVFEPFFSTKFAGRGLGLASVLGIVHGHKGSVRVSSRVNQGSTFEMFLPVPK